MTRNPSIVVHGGAGSISKSNIPPNSPTYTAYATSLRTVLEQTYPSLIAGATALDAATRAVSQLEDNPLFNAGKGAVFTRDGRNELEASVMVSRGCRKRGVGVQMLRTVKNPILLAKEVLVRDEVAHNCLSGEEAEKLAEGWGCEIVDPGYFWTRKRWEQHKRGLEKGNCVHSDGMDGMDMDPVGSGEYLPQGTVGCVVLDVYGTLCVATSTGGLTNKLPGRIGDTPTIGAGFWAEEWEASVSTGIPRSILPHAPFNSSLWEFLSSCFPEPRPPPATEKQPLLQDHTPQNPIRAVALSGTGNGDYFLRLAAAHNIAAQCRFGGLSLRKASEVMVGRGGEMQRAAGDRWGSGDGEGGFIGLDEKGSVVMVMNCGGMIRGFIDGEGRARVGVYWDEEET